jgi:hypothetical protein
MMPAGRGFLTNNGVYDFIMNAFGGKSEYCLKGFPGHCGVIFQYLSFGPALGKKSEDKFDRNPGSLNHRFPQEDLGVALNVFFPIHFFVLIKKAKCLMETFLKSTFGN